MDTVIKILLFPLSFGLFILMKVRNLCYDRGFFSVKKLDVPVISVGNLTLGGGGKTPLVKDLAQSLEKKGFKVGIVSRGYKRKSFRTLKVDPEVKNAASRFGDEPVLLAKALPNCSIYVGKDRFKTGKKMLKKEKVDVILADDAFQHRKLHRDCNILVLDGTKSLDAYKFYNLKSRESLDSLKRADIVIFTKTNLAKEENIKSLEKNVPILKSQAFAKTGYEIESFFSYYEGNVAMPLKEAEHVLMVSGVENPRSFETLFSYVYPFSVMSRLDFKDHHQYTASDVDFILREKERVQADKIFTTTKDFVKLKEHKNLLKYLYSINIEVSWFLGEEEVMDLMLKHIRRSTASKNLNKEEAPAEV